MIFKRILCRLCHHRATDRITLMASEEGGTEIEEVAAKTPEKSLKKQSIQ